MNKSFVIHPCLNGSFSLMFLIVIMTIILSIYSENINQLQLIDYFNINKSYNRLLQLEDGVFNDSYIEVKPEERKPILHSLVFFTYNGNWSTNSSIPLFKNTNGIAQLEFKLSRKSKRFKGFHYNYRLLLYDGKYNQHSLILSNIESFWFEDILPLIYTDTLNETVYISNNQPFYIKDLQFYSVKYKKEIKGSLLFNFKYLNKLNRTIIGRIKFDEICISFEVNKSNVVYFGDILMILSLLFIIVIFQVIICTFLGTSIKSNESEALKYSQFNIVINCITNGVIGFECFYASLIIEQLSVMFAFPAGLYFIYSLYFEPKLLFKVMKIQLAINYNEEGIKKEFKRNAIRFYISYLVFFLMFYCLHDLFYWKVLIGFFVVITFVPQILFNLKSNRKQIINPCYIITIILNRLFIPLFFQAKDNFLHFKKDYPFAFTITLIMIFQISILIFQQYYRNIYLSRLIFRPRGYNYYKTVREILEIAGDICSLTCQICNKGLIQAQTNISQVKNDDCNNNCHDSKFKSKHEDISKKTEISNDTLQLDTLETVSMQHNNESLKRNNGITSHSCLRNNINYLNQLLMITPCNHIFHIDCLQQTIQLQADCFVCKQPIPNKV